MENINLDPVQKLTLINLVDALAHLEISLPPELQTEINHLGIALQEGDTTAVGKLVNLARQFEPLQNLYKKIRLEKHKEYRSQELNKGIEQRPLKKLTNIEEPNIIDNYVISSLTASDSAKKAKEKQEERNNNNREEKA